MHCMLCDFFAVHIVDVGLRVTVKIGKKTLNLGILDYRVACQSSVIFYENISNFSESISYLIT